MVRRRVVPAALVLSFLSLMVPMILGAQEGTVVGGASPLRLTLALDSSLSLVHTTEEAQALLPGLEPWTVLGLGEGSLRLASTGRDVRGEVLAHLSSAPVPTWTLERIWIKVRRGPVQGLSGLTRVDWGPALVLNGGNLLFPEEATQGSLGAGAGEVYTRAAWLAALNLALGPEAYGEVVVVVPPPDLVGIPGSALPAALDEASVGFRLGLAPGGLGLEVAAAWVGSERELAGAVSLQGNWGADWYGTLKVAQPMPIDGPESWAPAWSVNLGGFLMRSLGGGTSMTTRHEWLTHKDDAATLADFLASGASWHDLGLGSTDGWSLSVGALVDWAAAEGRLVPQASWEPVAGLVVYGRGLVIIDPRGLAPRPGALSIQAGIRARW